MSSSHTDKRIDPLVDAYLQASELDSQTSGARPGAAMRAAVLAHARVVAQSATTAEPKLAISDAVRDTPAANESKPVWRMVAGVVLGLAGMWLYQLTRPGTTGEANVAVLSAPPSAKATAPPIDKTAAPASPSAASTTSPPTQPEATVAVAAQVGPEPAPSTGAPGAAAVATVQTMRPAPLREREDSAARAGGSANSPTTVTRGVAPDAVANATRSEVSVAQAKIAAPLKKTESPAQMPASEASATTSAVTTAAPAKATGSATSAMADAATSEPLGEVAVATAATVADTRKLARTAEARAPAAAVTVPAAAAPALPTAPPPNAFPAVAAGAMAQSAPQPAAPAASPPPSFAASGNTAMRPGVAGAATTPDAAMFGAIRGGNVNALRAAIARGANVNARDEAGRSALQMARERNDTEMLKALDLAGAK